MVKLLNRAKMSVSGTPSTGNITLNAAVTNYQTFAQAGAVDTDFIRYAVEDGANWEVGSAVLSSSATVMARTVEESSNSNNPVDLTSAAIVFATVSAADFEANPAPRWTTEPPTTLNLANDGSTAVTLTGVAVDENFPVRYSWDGYSGSTIYDADSLPPQLASAPVINQSTGVTSLVGSSTGSNAGTYYHRSRATDGINTLWSTTAISLTFFNFTTAFTKTGITNGDRFGFCTATNGTYAAAGALSRPLSGTSHNGAVYVYNVSDGTGLSNFSPLTTTAADLYFGGALAMSDTLLAVSSLPNTTTVNKVRLYTFTSNTPVLTLSSSSTSTTDTFGQSIALSGDYLLISDTANSAVKVYAANDFGSYSRGDLIRTWTQGSAGTDTFGDVVKAHGDVAIISNRSYNPSAAASTGRVHRYSLASGNEVTSGVWPITGNVANSLLGTAMAVDATHAAISEFRISDGTAAGTYDPSCTVVNLSTNAIINTIDATANLIALVGSRVILGDGFDNSQTGKVTAYDIATGAAYNPTGWPLTGAAANDYFGYKFTLANSRSDSFSQASGVVLIGSERYSGGASLGRMLIVK